jgi:SagB-type dehydrogenase family enzyme
MFPFLKALFHRKTYRKFQESPITKLLLSTLLRELKDEIFEKIWHHYIVVFNVEEIPPGVYRYCPLENGLYLIKEGLFQNEVVKLLCGMAASYSASFSIIFSIDLKESMHRFPYSRALREIYIDSGRLAQKILLKGMQNNIGGLPSPAMKDNDMCSFLKINPCEYIPIYTVTMGVIPQNSFNNPVFI